MDFDYKKLGLKIGIEIHQQLDSRTKLFCNCPNHLHGTRTPDFTVLRQQRPVLGEEGKFDKGMLVEFLKRGSVIYEGYYDSSCTYELDETPPFPVNEECVDIALEISHLLKMDVIREMHVCRKNYVDGSVPGGFQRTMEMAQNGTMELKNGTSIGIENLFLEEDAARRIKTEGKVSYFRVDRLGIPLVEITTTPDIHSPEDAKETAYRIGLLLRSTNKVKRVLGAIRQDINISIAHGERIEVKGVQKLDWIPLLVNFECQRQLGLIEIKTELANRNLNGDDLQRTPIDVTDLFQNTPCKFVKAGIKKGLRFTALKLLGFKGIYGVELNPNRRFGTEVAEKVKALTGLKGLIHSDEDLRGKYQFSAAELTALKKKLQVQEHDLFVLLLAKGQALETALDIIMERSQAALRGVPEETRQAQDDGSHIFLRELGGGRRLYPDTDSPPILLDNERISLIHDAVGPYPWDVIKEAAKKYKLAEDRIEDLIMTGKLALFEKLAPILPENLTLVLRSITDFVKVLHRESRDTSVLTDDHFVRLLTGLKDGKIAKEALEAILRVWTDEPGLPLAEAKKKAGISEFDISTLDQIVIEIVEKNKELIQTRGRGAMGALMGDLMKAVGRGAVDGKILSSTLNQKMAPYLPKTTGKPKKGKKTTKKKEIKGAKGE
ncbi:MAG: Glu-tRNA(Gln) amidotransferase subunit GatE [Promethearchaeota archaeon]